MAISNAPETLTFNKPSDGQKKHKNPKNLASGIGYGSWAFCKGIVTGIGGLVYEPYIGARKKGAKGLAVGVGKGVIGLVAKPVGGTVGLVGLTA